ncbi:hypothetical protein AUR64_09455 [Haloprofundus marisrubri]|uniref:Uncharacterized protein n=1 Tax=Haloprofundus marisrubri TaxID=1514971 RepID=A0A0W1R9Q4_9EURY|nr:DUF6517 family protein [Haloprofundus marisrubri]KTG09845.1 hypothetical protein AUR64_09455 [Haloprofundus marisrubri]
MRRTPFLLPAVVLLVVLSGCVGGDALTLESNPASIPDEALAETGYQPGESRSVVVERQLGIAGTETNVTLVGWLSSYNRPDGGASVVLLSTPNPNVAGVSANPLAGETSDELVERLLEQSNRVTGDSVGELRRVGETNRTVLGEQTTVVTYEASVRTDNLSVDGSSASNESIPVRFHVATVSHGDDVVVALAMHPADLDEEDALLSLFERIEHEG